MTHWSRSGGRRSVRLFCTKKNGRWFYRSPVPVFLVCSGFMRCRVGRGWWMPSADRVLPRPGGRSGRAGPGDHPAAAQTPTAAPQRLVRWGRPTPSSSMSPADSGAENVSFWRSGTVRGAVRWSRAIDAQASLVVFGRDRASGRHTRPCQASWPRPSAAAGAAPALEFWQPHRPSSPQENPSTGNWAVPGRAPCKEAGGRARRRDSVCAPRPPPKAYTPAAVSRFNQ